MKFDKDTVIKHHFWFLLGTAMPLALVGIVILMTVVASQIAANQKKLENDLKSTKVTDAKNELWLQEIGKVLDKTRAREKTVWEEAYNKQKGIFTWPEEIENKFDFQHGLFASEIKADKGINVTPVDPKKEKDSVVKQLTGIVKGTEEPKDSSGNSLGVVVMTVNDGKKNYTIRPTRDMKLTRDGKKINSFYKFERGDKVSITYVQGKYFGDPLTEEEQNFYARSDEGYRTQIAGILKQVQPLNKKGEGVVQLPGWRDGQLDKAGNLKLPSEDAHFLRYVTKEDWENRTDISDEAWVAQEDLWIQRELYRLVRQTNDMVSVFEGQGGAEQNKWYTFKNPYWKLDLILNGKNVGARITNLLPRRQRLDLKFLVTLFEGDNVEPTRIPIPGEPIDPGVTYPPPTSPPVAVPITGKAPTGIYRVEQAIDWETAAVKRIDKISIGSLDANDCCHSHRTFPEGLKSFRPPKVDKAAPAQAGGENNKMMMGKPNMPPAGGQKVGANDKKPRNVLSLDRYVEQPKPEVRRVPFGIVLIVGQEHIDRVLFQFSNSPLRILMTQVIANHYPHSVRPSSATSAQDAGNRLAGNRGFGGFPNFGGGMGFGGQAAAPAAGTENNQETNIELVIYGIASLYQRYPPRPAQAGGGTAP